jgi:hypothetical protein
LIGNAWDFWAFPAVNEPPIGVMRMTGLPPTDRERAPTFEEAKYSSGWGLPAASWRVWRPDPAEICPELPTWDACDPIPDHVRVIVTHRLTRALVGFMEAGGRVVLMASLLAGNPECVYLPTWQTVPLVIEGGPLATGDSEWIVDLYQHDLTRRTLHAIATEAMGLDVRPIVRAVQTHDKGRPVVHDMLMAARVGGGLFVAGTVDFGSDAGRHLLDRVLRFAGGDVDSVREAIDPSVVRSWISESV